MTLLHLGDHSALSLNEIPWHLLEADHIVFILATIAVGVFAFRAGRRAEAKARVRKLEGNHDTR